MKRKIIYIAIVIIVMTIIAMVFWYLKIPKVSLDRTIEGDYTIEEGEELVIKDGSTLTIEGDLTIRGKVVCENGSLNLIVKGKTKIENKIECDQDISIVIGEGLETTKESKIIIGGSLRITDTEGDLSEDIDELFEEEESFIKRPSALYVIDGLIQMNGMVVANKPKKGKKLVVLLKFNKFGINFEDFTLEGPESNDGEDKEGGCLVEGEDGQDGLNFYAKAPDIRINNFNLTLGSGGNGGKATTAENCEHGKAYGGNGGKPGSLKMIGYRNFEIVGDFIIKPGRAGSGGNAVAYGKHEGVGGDATAIGGKGADSQADFNSWGSVTGVEYVKVGLLTGGSGGSAYAFGGNGEDGSSCNDPNGKDGGNAMAEAGSGGNVLLSGPVDGMTSLADIPGDAGIVYVVAGDGGDGADCKPYNPGGDGGDGGNAEFTAGSGGKNGGRDTIVEELEAGDGGDGGHGCPPGMGGQGGEESGEDGFPGVDFCESQGPETPPREPIPSDSVRIRYICEVTQKQAIGFMEYNLRATTIFLDNLIDTTGLTIHYEGEESGIAQIDGDCWQGEYGEEWDDRPACKDIVNEGALLDSLDVVKEYYFPNGFDYDRDENIFFEDFIEVTDAKKFCK